MRVVFRTAEAATASGGRHDGAERHAGGPGQFGRQHLRHDRHTAAVNTTAPERQQQDGAQRRPEGGPVGAIGADLEQGRQKKCERDMGIEFDTRYVGHESQCHAAEDQRHGGWHAGVPGRIGQGHAGGEQTDEYLDEFHAAPSEPALSSANAKPAP